jgi:hypothetical protein
VQLEPFDNRVYIDSFTVPARPGPGDKFTWTVWFENLANITRESIVVSFWANSTDKEPCGASGAGKTITLKNVKPREIRTITAKLTAPEAEGAARARVAIDPDCQMVAEPAQTTVDYSVNSNKTWDVVPVNYNAVTNRLTVSTLTMAIVGQPFELASEFFNAGQLPSPDGLKVGVWYKYIWSTWQCGLEPNVTFTLPKIAPGKSYTVKVPLVAQAPSSVGTSLVYFEVDPYCEYPEFPRTGGTQYTYYDSSYAPMPRIWGAERSKYGDLAFKLAPASPKAGVTAKAKLTVTNLGNAPGVVGQVKVWLVPNEYSWPSIKLPGERCNYTGEAASATFNDTTIEPGKTKKITVPDVPIPSAPGSYYLAAEVGSGFNWGGRV